jgi:hypothetical protein
MERGLLVELSPNESKVLCQIASGYEQMAMRHDYITRLKLLALIERRGDAMTLTALGERRLSEGRLFPK